MIFTISDKKKINISNKKFREKKIYFLTIFIYFKGIKWEV